MVSVSYVYPNVSQMTYRGGIRSGLLRRWKFAQKLDCEYVEVPADFARSCKPLEKEALMKVYEKKEEAIPKELKYVLHTEPVLQGYDVLKWYDKQWLEQFTNMMLSLSELLGKPADIIEIHPSERKQVTFENIAGSIRYLLEKYGKEFSVEPLILLENRTEQRISRARDIRDFWNFICDKHSDLKSKIGIVLDVQQLYTQEKLNWRKCLDQSENFSTQFIRKFDLIPLETLRGFHIHVRSHQVPSRNDDISWSEVFDRIKHI